MMMKRRGLLTLGALAAAGLAVNRFALPPGRSIEQATVQTLSARFFNSLDPQTREEVCVPYDHPYRQYHNRGVWGGGARIHPFRFDREQRTLLTDLLYAGLSKAGADLIPNQYFINWPGVHLTNVLVCGDPNTATFQTILTGPHLNLRLGGKNREGVAFGGPQVYGDQRGNEKQGLPGNRYQFQFLLAQELYESLPASLQQAATLEETPIQTQVEVQGRNGKFPGIPVSEMGAKSKGLVSRLVNGILSTYAEDDSAYAWECLEHNGGIDSLYISYYTEGEASRSGQYQIFRLEGPGSVLFFLGYPHVHGFVNIAMDAENPLSLGDVIGTNPTLLSGAKIKVLFEDAMRSISGADFAYYPDESVVGRLRPGKIRTGDIYNAESWQDSLIKVKAQGGEIQGQLRARLEAHGTELRSGQVYSIATSGYVANNSMSDILLQARSKTNLGLMRDAIISHIQNEGFSSA